jgi:hypothetical protein
MIISETIEMKPTRRNRITVVTASASTNFIEARTKIINKSKAMARKLPIKIIKQSFLNLVVKLSVIKIYII